MDQQPKRPIPCPLCGSDFDESEISPNTASLWGVVFAVLQEMARQDGKWGEQLHDHQTWLTILTEEVGEAAEAILHSRFGGKAAGKTQKEVMQIAAVALQWMKSHNIRLEQGDKEIQIATEDVI